MFKNKHIALTGAAGGIGRAIAQMFIAEGGCVTISDVQDVTTCARQIGALGIYCDVADEDSVSAFINAAQAQNGPIDIYVSNAGVGFSDSQHVADTDNAGWQLSWQVNVMASVYAARILLPDWIARGHGRFVITASAAGLLNQIGSASYSATKHAAVGFAEALALAHKDQGISCHCICPQYVRSNMTKGQKFAEKNRDGLLEPEDVARVLREAIVADQFLVLPHAVVTDYFKHKAHDYQAYITGMAKLKKKMIQAG